MTEKSLWGDFGTFEAIRTPSIILREQAEFVARFTDQILLGEVKQSSYQGVFFVELNVVAPALQRYRYKVLELRHGVELYPTEISDYVNDRAYTADDEARLLIILQEVLSLDRVKQTMSVLISESGGKENNSLI